MLRPKESFLSQVRGTACCFILYTAEKGFGIADAWSARACPDGVFALWFSPDSCMRGGMWAHCIPCVDVDALRLLAHCHACPEPCVKTALPPFFFCGAKDRRPKHC